MVGERIEAGEPVISVDTKKKELIGNYANGGTEWHPGGEPTRVDVHDFADRALGEFAKAVPYGIYDVANNEGWVNVGDSADTGEFAVESIRRWWNTLGRDRFPGATRLVITADAGGSNGYRPRSWKWHLAQLAAETGLEITVAHYPPGTSKWNRIEHRLFSFISMNWRGKPLTDIRTIVELIAGTHTDTGLTVQSRLRQQLVREGRQDHQHPNGRPRPPPPRLAWRMELHDHTVMIARPIPRRALTRVRRMMLHFLAVGRGIVGGPQVTMPTTAAGPRCQEELGSGRPFGRRSRSVNGATKRPHPTIIPPPGRTVERTTAAPIPRIPRPPR